MIYILLLPLYAFIWLIKLPFRLIGFMLGLSTPRDVEGQDIDDKYRDDIEDYDDYEDYGEFEDAEEVDNNDDYDNYW